MGSFIDNANYCLQNKKMKQIFVDTKTWIGPTKEQELFAQKMIDLIEYVDEVLSAKYWFAKMMEE